MSDQDSTASSGPAATPTGLGTAPTPTGLGTALPPTGGGGSLVLPHDAPRSSGLARVRRHVRPEDVLLFAWLIVTPILFPPAAGTTRDGTDLVAGLLDLAALSGLAACLIGRSRPDVRSGLVSGSDFAFAVGPLFGAVAFLLDDTVTRLGLADNLGLAPIAIAVAVGLVARFRLPPLSAEQRRALVTPFVLAASGFFGQFAGGISAIFDLRSLADVLSTPSASGEAAFVLGIAVLGILVFYAMFVYAPSQIAQREGTTRTWAVRFAIFLLGLAIGTTIRGH